MKKFRYIFALVALLVFAAPVINIRAENAEKTSKAADIDEARNIVRDYMRPIVQKHMHELVYPEVREAVIKSLFDYTHYKFWHPSRLAVRDKACEMYFNKAREAVAAEFKDKEISKDALEKLQKDVHEKITGQIVDKTESMVKDAYLKLSGDEKMREEAIAQAQKSGEAAALSSVKKQKLESAKKQLIELASKKFEEIKPDDARPGMSKSLPANVCKNVIENSAKGISKSLPENMAKTMFDARVKNMETTLPENMGEHMYRHISKQIWQLFQKKLNGRNASSVTDEEWSDLLKLATSNIEKDVESKDHLKRSYNLRWKLFKEQEEKSRGRNKPENK